MTEFKIGDIVDVEIKRARVQLVDPHRILLASKANSIWAYLTDDSMTITKQTPKLQFGDVWREPGGRLWFVNMAYPRSKGAWLTSDDGHERSSIDWELESVNLADAELLFRKPQES